jgi:hypothetical protein
MQWSVGSGWLWTPPCARLLNWRLHGDASSGAKPWYHLYTRQVEVESISWILAKNSVHSSSFCFSVFLVCSFHPHRVLHVSFCFEILAVNYIYSHLSNSKNLKTYWRWFHLAVLCLGELTIDFRLYWACAPGWASTGIKLPDSSRSRIWSCQRDNFQFFLSQTHVKEQNLAIRKLAVPHCMRNKYRVKQRLPKRVMWQISPPPVRHSHSSTSLALRKIFLPTRLSLFQCSVSG